MKKKIKPYIMVTCFVLILIALGCKPNHLFGSNTDWLNQHTVFAEYFRTIFYETKQILPNFAFHLGAGQNIFNFAYYGLLNPLILISYFLPFLSMTTYIQIINIVLSVTTVNLFYYFLQNKKLSPISIIISTLLFACAVPLIYHAHRHMMFVDYLPFLLLGLIGIDRYFVTNKRALITISVFLMIMISYYYSIGGLLCLAIYYVYQYLNHNKDKSLKDFLKSSVSFVVPCGIGILSAAVLLLPTIYVILTGRSDSTTGINLLSLLKLLIPQLNVKTFLYDSYNLGLTSISLMALVILLLSKEKSLRYLSGACLFITLIPIVMYLLNGALYVRSKVLIPFLPLFLLVSAEGINKIVNKKYYLSFTKWLIISIVILVIIGYLYHYEWFYLLAVIADIVITLGLLYLYQKKRKNYFLGGIVLIAILINVSVNQIEDYVSIDKYKQINDSSITKSMEQIELEDKSLYRMKQLNYNLPTINKIYTTKHYLPSVYSSIQNENYKEFYNNYLGTSIANRNSLMISNTSNYFFDNLVGVKYLIGKNKELDSILGYDKIDSYVYKNQMAYPLMYATAHLYSEDEFDNLSYKDQIGVMLGNAVVKNENSNVISTTIDSVALDYTMEDKLNISKDNERYHFTVTKPTKLEIDLTKPLANQILLLNFDILNEVSCQEGDRTITINGKVNKITCEDWIYNNHNRQFNYVLANKTLAKLTIEIEPGVYEIGNIETLVLDYDDIKNYNKDVDEFVLDSDKMITDTISGHINVTRKGYFITSIPYDKGFTIMLDKKLVAYEQVNKGFIGFPINEGYHTINIKYEAPLVKEGKILSLLGGILFLGLITYDKKHQKK